MRLKWRARWSDFPAGSDKYALLRYERVVSRTALENVKLAKFIIEMDLFDFIFNAGKHRINLGKKIVNLLYQGEHKVESRMSFAPPSLLIPLHKLKAIALLPTLLILICLLFHRYKFFCQFH